jgi:hypothetical protein
VEVWAPYYLPEDIYDLPFPPSFPSAARETGPALKYKEKNPGHFLNLE